MMMDKKICLITLLLVSIMKSEMTTKTNMLEIPKSDIIHTASGLVLHYISQYRPSKKKKKSCYIYSKFPDGRRYVFFNSVISYEKIPVCKNLYVKTRGIQIR